MMKERISRKWLSVFIMTILVFTWGSSFILMKKSLQYFPSDIVGAFRMMAAFTIMFIPAVLSLKKLPIRKIALLTLSGILANAIPAFLFAKAQTGIESYVAGILNSTTTLFTLIIGMAFFAYHTKWLSVAGVLTGLAGVAGLLAFAGGKSIAFNFSYGGLILIATMLYAFNINLIKRWLSDVPTLPMVSIVFLFPGLFAIVYLFGFTPFVSIVGETPGSGYGIIYMSILGIVGSALALLLYYHLIKISDIIFVASVTYLMPIVSTLWGLGDGEYMGWLHVLFILVILAGVFMANFHDIKSKIKKQSNPASSIQ